MSAATLAHDREEIARLLEMLAARPWPDGVEEARVHYDSLGPRIAADITVERIDAGGVEAQLLTPPELVGGQRAILYLHGGGYVFGSLASHAGMVAELARAARCRVLQIDYRRAPEHPYPAALEDACSSYQWLLARDYDARRICIAGDSAGGGLALATIVRLRELEVPLPGAAVCISPWVDMEARGESYCTRETSDPLVTRRVVDQVTKLYLNGQDPRTPTVSPIHADLAGFPALLVQVGEREILFSDAAALARKARAADVDVTFEEWREMVHVWHLHFRALRAGRAAIERIGGFVLGKTHPCP